MKKEIIYSLKGIYREDYQIEGYRFGGGEKSACIVGAYAGGKVIQEIGGGICQVSSTLYNAVLYADLEIVERSNHYYSSIYFF